MHITNTIIKPILTEKTNKLMSTKNIFVFKVNKKVNKIEIKKSFEIIFEVKVKKVNIMNYKPKTKKKGKFIGKTNFIKKAIITLKDNQKLDFLSENKK